MLFYKVILFLLAVFPCIFGCFKLAKLPKEQRTVPHVVGMVLISVLAISSAVVTIYLDIAM